MIERKARNVMAANIFDTAKEILENQEKEKSKRERWMIENN